MLVRLLSLRLTSTIGRLTLIVRQAAQENCTLTSASCLQFPRHCSNVAAQSPSHILFCTSKEHLTSLWPYA